MDLVKKKPQLRGVSHLVAAVVALVFATALVASAPLEGFLHQRNELDTLGRDAPETACTAFGSP